MKTLYMLSAALALVLWSSGLRAQDEDVQPQSPADVLPEISADMNAAALRLAKLKTDTPTQKTQKDAISKLDGLIAALEAQKQGMGGVSDPNPTDPARASNIRKGPGGMGTLTDKNKDGKDWGELPAKERERILQSMNEGFPTHYQKLLERYFARLADEKPATQAAEEAGEDAKPGADPQAVNASKDVKPAAAETKAPPSDTKSPTKTEKETK